jgi:hypothetical protein
MHHFFYRSHSNCNYASTVSEKASAAVLKLPISRTHTHAKVQWFNKCRVSLGVSFFTHAHFSVSHLYTTCLAVYTRDGQLQLCTTPTPLQISLYFKNSSLFQFRSKSIPFLKIPLHSNSNIIYEASHSTTTSFPI